MNLVLLSLALLASDEHLSPAESIAKIKLPPGLVVELAAHEPNVESPVAISFDEHGRMFVAEYRDYPNGPPKGEPPLSRIRLLEDKDGDGFFEKATIYADKLSFAQGVLAYNGGVIVTAAPHILFLKDTNGDGVADEKKIWFTGFKEGNPQLRVSHPKLGLDHKVYVANGLSGGEVRRADGTGPAIKLDRDDFCFDPRTLVGEACTGFGQFGNTFDDWGRRFTCSNRNPVIHCFLPKRILNRNDQIPIAVGYGDVAPSGSDSRVYPVASTETTAESHAGTHTAACGVHIYRGDLLGDAFRGDVFVCEPTGFLVTRSKLIPQGAGFRTERDRPNEDFMASTDRWFRPVSLADGPDGALYVVDMHREVIEHPAYLPKGVGANLRFRAGAEKGRILRIRPKGMRPAVFTPFKTESDLVALLESRNGWRRDLGQRIVIDEGFFSPLADELRRLQRFGTNEVRVQAIWTEACCGKWHNRAALLALKENDDPSVIENVLLASRHLISLDTDLRGRVCELTNSPHHRVRMVAATLVGESEGPSRALDLWRAATASDLDPWIERAVLSSSKGVEGSLFALVAQHDSFSKLTLEQAHFLERLSEASVHRDEDQLRETLATLRRCQRFERWGAAGLLGLAAGFRRQNPYANDFNGFLQSPPSLFASEVAAIRPLLSAADAVAFDSGSSIADRALALRISALQPQSTRRLADAIGFAEPAEIQNAALSALGDRDPKLTVDRIESRWSALPPAVQTAAIDFCFKRRDSQLMLLKAIEAKKIPASVVGFERREMMLVFSGDKEIKALAEKLFGAASSNRVALIEQYSSALRKSGDTAKGLEIFKRVCSSCHRLKGIGVEVGPPLADVRQKTKETLLADILDPNRTFEPRFGSSIAILKDGRSVVGLPTSENENFIFLRLANGQQESIARSAIETFRSSGRSLMPEGVEKDVSPAQMNDLLEFLKAPN